MVDKGKLYGGSELAQAFGLTSQALRFYEEKGLLSPARSGRARVYTYRDWVRLSLIQRLRRLGFSLDTIVEYIGLYGTENGEQYQVGLGKIRQRLEELYRMRSELEETIAELHRLEGEAVAKLNEARRR
jgi:DNA-binding transcriptional MerR regulator